MLIFPYAFFLFIFELKIKPEKAQLGPASRLERFLILLLLHGLFSLSLAGNSLDCADLERWLNPFWGKQTRFNQSNERKADNRKIIIMKSTCNRLERVQGKFPLSLSLLIDKLKIDKFQ